MKVFTMSGDSFDFEGELPPIGEIKSFITDYELTVSSQQKLALLYYKAGKKEMAVEILNFSLSNNLFSTENSDILKLTLLSLYIETKIEGDEISKLFSQLETTKFQKELKILKGYYLFSQNKFDTALFCLEDDTFAKNMIYLAKKQPEKVESSDNFFNGYKQYLMGDLNEAIRHFSLEYERNKKVLVYLIALKPEIFLNPQKYPTDQWINRAPEYILSNIFKIPDILQREAQLEKYCKINEQIKEEFHYQKGKRLHIEKKYSEALENYVLCESNLADYQLKRICGIKHEKCEELNEIQRMKENYRKSMENPVEEFKQLKKMKNLLDDCTYYNNRGVCLYFIETRSQQILKEIHDDLLDSYDFSVGPVLSYFNKALESATPEQKKAVRFNKETLEDEEQEDIDKELFQAIRDAKTNSERSLPILIEYLSGERGEINNDVGKMVATAIGVCLALNGDKFSKQIFEYLNDQTNLNAFRKNFKK